MNFYNQSRCQVCLDAACKEGITCDGGKCDECHYMFVSLSQHQCPYTDNLIHDSQVHLLNCAMCHDTQEVQKMRLWNCTMICSSCYDGEDLSLERKLSIASLHTTFFSTNPYCFQCDSRMCYSWQVNHELSDLIRQGDEELALQQMKQMKPLCLKCITDEKKTRYGDNQPWVCQGKCNRRFSCKIMYQRDCNSRVFMDKTYCVECYENDKTIEKTINFLKKSCFNSISQNCGRCEVKMDYEKDIFTRGMDPKHLLFAKSLDQIINEGDITAMECCVESGRRLLCRQCDEYREKLERLSGACFDRQLLNKTREEMIVHPMMHPDLCEVLDHFTNVLRRKTRQKFVMSNFIS